MKKKVYHLYVKTGDFIERDICSYTIAGIEDRILAIKGYHSAAKWAGTGYRADSPEPTFIMELWSGGKCKESVGMGVA